MQEQLEVLIVSLQEQETLRAGIAGKMDALKQEAEHLKNDIRVSEGSAKKDPRPQSILITMLSSCFPSRQELRLEETSRRMVMDVWWAVQHV